MEGGAGFAVADDNVAAEARDEVEHTHTTGRVCIYVARLATSLLGAPRHALL